MHRTARVAGLAAVLLLAGCAAGAGTGDPGPTPPAPTTPPSTAPTSTPGQPHELTVEGVAEPGVEPGCVVLREADKQYVLVGAGGKTPTGVPMGVPIRVRAAVLTGVLSYCQQGTTIQVLQVSRR
jgi:hypothetical protein